MAPEWQQFLCGLGANLEGGVVRDFGDAGAELGAARAQMIVADLSHLGVLEFEGADVETFLQGQLSCDVRSLGPGSATFGGYCTAKGRLLASFVLWRDGPAYRMVLSRSIAARTEKRLRMYVLRSKVRIADRSEDLVLLGVSGDGSGGVLAKAFPDRPRELLQVTHAAGLGSVIALPRGRHIVAVTPPQASAVWESLAAELRPVGTSCWEWLDIVSGLPLVTERTVEQFVPQMINLDLIGGVSFSKGCYTGQEVVARTQYLGKVKRRMYRAHADTTDAPLPGDEVYRRDREGKAVGAVVNSQPAPGGGFDLLVTMQLSDRESESTHLRSADGPVLKFADLPYPIS